MPSVLLMPKLGLTMTEGLVSRWLVAEGDSFRKGQPIVEVMTEKITNEVEAPEDGVLLQIVVAEGETAEVGAPIAYLGAAGATAPEPVAAAHDGPTAAPHAPVAAAGSEERLTPLTPLRRVIGQRMTQSFRDVPHFVVSRQVDMAAAVSLREGLNAASGPAGGRISFTDIFVRAVAVALSEHPVVNASFDDAGLRYHVDVNVGVAVAIPEGLIVPVIRRASEKTIAEIAADARALAEKARANRLEERDVTGGTFTISNMGMYGVDQFTAIINPPQAAILAAGSVAERPLVVAGRLEVRPTCFFSLSCDHRVLDGATGAAFLATLKEVLEAPGERLGG